MKKFNLTEMQQACPPLETNCYVGLDVAAQNSGIAVVGFGDNSTLPELLYCATIEGVGKGLLRAARLADDVMRAVNVVGCRAVAIEGYSYASMPQMVNLVECGTVVRYFLAQNAGEVFGYDVVEPSPSELKKFVTGKGSADKGKMLIEAHKRWGWGLSDHNENDAACLAVLAAAWAVGGLVTKPMQEVANKVRVLWEGAG
jgi:Holliday junction resolvasome RuvABC endonuclease subunit